MGEERKDGTSHHRSKDLPVILLLFIGFSGVIGLLATVILGIPLPLAFTFIAFAALGLPLGITRLKKSQSKTKPIVISSIASIILLPVYIPMGIAIGFFTPTIPSYLKIYFTGPNIVQSVMSPDGNFEAYVTEAPSIDPPNQALFIQRNDNIHFVLIAKLPEDIDSIKNIHWSPQSDIVVFHTRCSLIAVSLPGYQTVKIPLGAEWTRTKADKRSTFTGAGPRFAVADIQFTHSESFSYRLEGGDKLKTIQMGSFN